MSIEEIQAQIKKMEERRKQLEARIADIRRRQEKEAEARRTRAKIRLAEWLLFEHRDLLRDLVGRPSTLTDADRDLLASILPPPPPPAPAQN
jgi:molecular chaperone GrpE (heat shock protein)